jgi:hypothetical protein
MSFTVWIFLGFNFYGIKYPTKKTYDYGCDKMKTTPASTIITSIIGMANTTLAVTEKSK